MQFIIKFFPEMTIKSKPVRKQFTQQLSSNLKTLLRAIDAAIEVQWQWDKITIDTPELSSGDYQQVVETLSNTPGIAYFLEVDTFPLGDFDDMAEKTLQVLGERIHDRSFVVRCKRAGQHEFTSTDVERQVGGRLLVMASTRGVDLHNPDVTVRLEVRQQTLYIVKQQHKGLGGFPIGSLDSVVSLISGGFDSPVASYLTMKRGLRTHFLFFNLGGRAHEVGVKEIAVYLWLKYGASHRVKFIAVPFEEVVAELLTEIDDSQMGVILKRMMLRAAEQIADQLKVQALVTGEAVAQVSSQTLTNLSVIDSVTNKLVLRPLITADKEDIIATARKIGTEEFAAKMPEYCGVISVKPTTKAKPEKIAREEQQFDFSVLERAVANTKFLNIDELVDEKHSEVDVEVLSVPVSGSVIIDVRHPTEEERKPLRLNGIDVAKIPFYDLHQRFAELDQNTRYWLYCDKGIMSRLHAAYLVEEGYHNVGVYRPAS